jgi:hypothetical protein
VASFDFVKVTRSRDWWTKKVYVATGCGVVELVAVAEGALLVATSLTTNA